MKYQRQADSIQVPTDLDWAWAAGFLEGEGTFSPMSGSDKRARVSANQKEIEPLERLLRLFGGRIYFITKGRPTAIHLWMLRGERARVFLTRLLPMMCSRRQGQINKALGSTFSVDHGSPERYAQHSELIRATYRARISRGSIAVDTNPSLDAPIGAGG